MVSLLYKQIINFLRGSLNLQFEFTVLRGFYTYEIRIYSLLRWYLNQSWCAQLTLLFTHRSREKNWINLFLIGLSSKLNLNNLNQDLNSGLPVHFLRQ